MITYIQVPSLFFASSSIFRAAFSHICLENKRHVLYDDANSVLDIRRTRHGLVRLYCCQSFGFGGLLFSRPDLKTVKHDKVNQRSEPLVIPLVFFHAVMPRLIEPV